MFPGLRHNSLIYCDHYHGNINSASSSQHILYKPFMAWHINNPGFPVIRKFQKRKTIFNCNPPPFFLCQAIRIRACQRLDQPGFTMINMSGSTYDPVPFFFHIFFMPHFVRTIPLFRFQINSAKKPLLRAMFTFITILSFFCCLEI